MENTWSRGSLVSKKRRESAPGQGTSTGSWNSPGPSPLPPARPTNPPWASKNRISRLPPSTSTSPSPGSPLMPRTRKRSSDGDSPAPITMSARGSTSQPMEERADSPLVTEIRIPELSFRVNGWAAGKPSSRPGPPGSHPGRATKIRTILAAAIPSVRAGTTWKGGQRVAEQFGGSVTRATPLRTGRPARPVLSIDEPIRTRRRYSPPPHTAHPLPPRKARQQPPRSLPALCMGSLCNPGTSHRRILRDSTEVPESPCPEAASGPPRLRETDPSGGEEGDLR